MATIQEQIISASNYSTMAQAQSKTTQSANSSSSSSTVSSQQFLKLLTEQLKYQDPTNPTDNSEMLAQEAQFATLEQMENLSSSFSKFSNIYQANSLLGQTVEVTVNQNTTKGVVDYVDYSDSNGAAISINGNSFPLSSVTKIYPSSNSSNTTDEITQEDKSAMKTTMDTISNNISDIASKLSNYISNDNKINSTTNVEI